MSFLFFMTLMGMLLIACQVVAALVDRLPVLAGVEIVIPDEIIFDVILDYEMKREF